MQSSLFASPSSSRYRLTLMIFPEASIVILICSAEYAALKCRQREGNQERHPPEPDGPRYLRCASKTGRAHPRGTHRASRLNQRGSGCAGTWRSGLGLNPPGADCSKSYYAGRVNVGSWHEADIKQRPLFGRYGVESGHHRLAMSISALTQLKHWPTILL
jgi:hypothetical protein